jgi:hypothetical protein
MIRGEVDGARRGGCSRREFGREREHVAGGRDDVLRVAAVALDAHHLVLGARRLVALEAVRAAAAGEVVVDVDAVAGADAGRARAGRDHLAGDVVARNEGKPGRVGVPDILAHPDVEPVHGDRRDPYQHLARPGDRVRPFLEGQHLRAAVA